MAFKVWSDSKSSVPTVYLHSFRGEGEDVWKACHDISCPPFNLVSIHDINLDAALTPWPAQSIRKGQSPFGGKAKIHLEEIINKIMYEVENQLIYKSSYNILAGYSLAGLFALWGAWQTEKFKCIACVSGSLWYPDFLDYLQNTKLTHHPECIYFSLGNKESRTHHPLMSQIDDCTEQAYRLINTIGIPTIYESNPGNHFTDPDKRMAKAIKWILEQQ